MVAVLCVALVVLLRWVKGLGGICLSSFSRTSLILSSVSFGETGRFRGTAGHEDFMITFQRLKDTGNLNTVHSWMGKKQNREQRKKSLFNVTSFGRLTNFCLLQTNERYRNHILDILWPYIFHTHR